MIICALCGKEAVEPIYIIEYKSNGFVWLLNDYICKDKCEFNLNKESITSFEKDWDNETDEVWDKQ